MVQEFVDLLINSIYWIFPAYMANGMPILFGGGKPIDLWKMHKDGNRVLGDGKTIRGAFFGIALGTMIGIAQGRFLTGFLLAAGAILGDLIGSYIKRRRGVKRGESFPGLDQYTFLIGALLLAALVEQPSLGILIVLLVLTPILHLIMNFLAYIVKLKKVPW